MRCAYFRNAGLDTQDYKKKKKKKNGDVLQICDKKLGYISKFLDLEVNHYKAFLSILFPPNLGGQKKAPVKKRFPFIFSQFTLSLLNQRQENI